jgi:hypothetical protein
MNTNLKDFLNIYLNDSNIECFNSCVKDFTSEKMNEQELTCLYSCFGKYFLAYSNVADVVLTSQKGNPTKP